MKYEDMLNEAYEKVTQVSSKDTDESRFKIPKIEGYFEGKKTILTNFFQVSGFLGRNPDHFQKFMLKELATSGHKDGERFILNNKIPSNKINQKIDEYFKEFVQCKECKKPDTELTKESSSRLTFIHCLACGAKHSIRGKI